MAELDDLFAKRSCEKLTENGDLAYSRASISDPLIDLLFMSAYYEKHRGQARIGNSERDKWFAQFMRDPRYGIGRRDFGRELMQLSGCSLREIVRAGRFDDLFDGNKTITKRVADFLRKEIESGNELAKKWMPRYSSKNLLLARQFAKMWGMNKQQYGKFIKVNTTENKLSRKHTEEINFEHVPSLAMLKYYKRFKEGEDTKYRFMEYLAKVNKGEAKLNISTTNIYDIYKNRDRIDADLFFNKIEKVQGSWLPILDTSGSMQDRNDSIGKANAVAHYLAKCSTYAPNKVVSFSSHPQLLELGKENEIVNTYWGGSSSKTKQNLSGCRTQYEREIKSMYTGDCSNTDFGAVMQLLSGLQNDLPEYLVVLSDMEFDCGSSMSKTATMKLFKQKGYKTRIIWWNFNSRNTTAPEMDSDGNIFMSGYSPMLLKFLEAGFNASQFVDKLLTEYKKQVETNA